MFVVNFEYGLGKNWKKKTIAVCRTAESGSNVINKLDKLIMENKEFIKLNQKKLFPLTATVVEYNEYAPFYLDTENYDFVNGEPEPVYQKDWIL